MRIIPFALTALVCLAASPARAADQAAVILKPSSPWNVDFAEDKCRLLRTFGEKGNRHIVFFEQYWPDDRTSLTAAGPGFKPFRSGKRTNLKFFEAQSPIRTLPFAGTSGQFGNAMIYSSISIDKGTEGQRDHDVHLAQLPRLDTGLAGKVQFVSLQQGSNEVRLLTGPMGDAFQVLNQCSQGLLSEWGLDEAKQLTATRMPRWINSESVIRKIVSAYPKEALEKGEEAIMRMRVIVSENGSVENCVIIKATDTDVLESLACKAMQGALFEPALDSNGKPMRSYFAESIVYQIR